MRWEGPDGYWASDDASLTDIDRVHKWLSVESYWAAGRPYEVMVRAVENSLVVGLFTAEGEQAGFSRFVTDYATFAWLCDVFVDSSHRGHGVGSFLVRTAVTHPAVRDLRQVLATQPGRSLYRRYGYDELASPERWMERSPKAPPVAEGTAGPQVP
jgi:GNAT superfamily N-acetyltransferase